MKWSRLEKFNSEMAFRCSCWRCQWAISIAIWMLERGKHRRSLCEVHWHMDGFLNQGSPEITEVMPYSETSVLSNLIPISLMRSIKCRELCGEPQSTGSLPWDMLLRSWPLRPQLTCQLFLPPALSSPSRVTGEEGVNPLTLLLWHPHHHLHAIQDLLM